MHYIQDVPFNLELDLVAHQTNIAELSCTSIARAVRSCRLHTRCTEDVCMTHLHCSSSSVHRAAVTGPIPVATTRTGLPIRVPYAMLRQKLLVVTFTLFCKLLR